MARTYVYVSAATAGVIDVFKLDLASGALSPLGSCSAGANVMPTALSPDGRRLYAAIRSEPFRVLTFSIDPASGMLNEVASAPLPASMPYIATALDGRMLLAASYGSDCAALLPIDPDGGVRSAAAQVLPTGRNAHAIVVDRSGRFVFVPCLGSDEIMVFRLDAASGRLAPHDPSSVATPRGFGPRHLVLSPDNRSLFVLGEFTGEVARFGFDGSTGRLDLVEVTPTVPPDAGLHPGGVRPPGSGAQPGPATVVWAADLRMTPDGRFLYATERTTSTIAVLAFDAEQETLRIVQHVPTETQPRGIGIDPSGRFLVASGETSGWIAAYAIDEATGMLAPVSRAPVSAGANWVEIATLS